MGIDLIERLLFLSINERLSENNGKCAKENELPSFDNLIVLAFFFI